MAQSSENHKRVPSGYVGLNVDEATEENGVQYAPSVRSGVLYPLRDAFHALRRLGKNIKLHPDTRQKTKGNS